MSIVINLVVALILAWIAKVIADALGILSPWDIIIAVIVFLAAFGGGHRYGGTWRL